MIRTELIPPDFRRRLIALEIGIGALIRDSGLESYREVLDVGLEHGEGPRCDPTGAAVGQPDASPSVFRTYRIIIGTCPVILITECFSLALFPVA